MVVLKSQTITQVWLCKSTVMECRFGENMSEISA